MTKTTRYSKVVDVPNRGELLMVFGHTEACDVSGSTEYSSFAFYKQTKDVLGQPFWVETTMNTAESDKVILDLVFASIKLSDSWKLIE